MTPRTVLTTSFISALLLAGAATLSAQGRPGVDLEGRTFGLGENPALGTPEAPVTVVEFLDFECGYCARHLAEILPLLQEEYIDTGKIRYVELDFPLTKIHRNAMEAARAGHCAAEQGRYWELRDRLLMKGATLSQWDDHIAAVELEGEAFDACLEDSASAKAVNTDLMRGQRLGVPGTPTLIVAKSRAGDPDRRDAFRGIEILGEPEGGDRPRTGGVSSGRR